MPELLGYFLTWPTYGTWLHGDERGSVDRAHNEYGTPTLSTDAPRNAKEAQRMSHTATVLDEESREIVYDSIVKHCRVRGWDLSAAAVRSNHVHVVVGRTDRPPERMMGEFKAWATRRLREAGRVNNHARLWAHHGSTRYLWTAKNVESTTAYVTEGQDVPQ